MTEQPLSARPSVLFAVGLEPRASATELHPWSLGHTSAVRGRTTPLGTKLSLEPPDLKTQAL